jgi:hypothetical protein
LLWLCGLAVRDDIVKATCGVSEFVRKSIEHGRLCRSRAQAVHPNAGRRHFQRNGPRHPDERILACDTGGTPRANMRRHLPWGYLSYKV